MSTEQHIDPEVIGVATDALLGVLGDALDRVPGSEIEIAAEAVIRAAEEKCGLRVETMEPDPQSTTQFAPQWRYVSDWHSSDGQAPVDPEGQEYAYRVRRRFPNGEQDELLVRSPETARIEARIRASLGEVCVERALLGTWERVER